MNKSLHHILFFLVAFLGSVLSAYGLDASHYATESVLASGRWVRVKVGAQGMHIITNADLKKMGFADPSKVKVYGSGGRSVGTALNASMYDDLPMQPSVTTSKGIVFYGVDQHQWTYYSSSTQGPGKHTIHPYDDTNYYFLSDSGRGQRVIPQSATSSEVSGSPATSFIDRMVHEVESEPAGDSGSQVYGEDFRTKTSQTFNFQLPENVGNDVYLSVRFAAKTTSGQSEITMTANGKPVASGTAGFKVAQSDKENYCRVGEFSSFLPNVGNELALNISYKNTGVLFKANLDYIEVFYERHLKLDGALNFYGYYSRGDALSISGCSSTTRIWDVTLPSAPVEVDFNLAGDKALFSVTQTGYREFVAFDPESVTKTATPVDGEVTNQDIHGLETPDMVILTLPEYREGAEAIAALHRRADGMRVHVIDAGQAYNEFSGGKKDVGAFRKMLKMWYDRGEDEDGHKIGYCLIMGKPLYDNKMVSSAAKNAGYTPFPIYESYDGLLEKTSFCNDDWIGMLADCSTFSGQDMAKAQIHIAVGRLPVTSAKEASAMAEKIRRYVEEPEYGPWRNRVQLIADDDDNNIHFDQSQRSWNSMKATTGGSSMIYERIYEDTYPRVLTAAGPTYPQATQRMIRNFNDGVMFTNYIGHGSPTGWGHEKMWEWEDINSMTNRNLTFFYTATCGFGYWDKPEACGAEVVLLNPESGAIGLITAARTVYIPENGDLNNCMSKLLLTRDEEGNSLRFGDVFRRMKTPHTSNDLRYVFMGDPAIRVPGGRLKVAFNEIAGTDITDPDCEYPELPARSSVKITGRITDLNGQTDETFNGTLNLQLFDAERAVSTLGQGKTGYEAIYNDRDQRLSATNVTVTNGLWEAMLHIPPEIQGNYSPAMIVGYVWDGKGNEGAGLTERLYVFGYNDEEGTDDKGPEISAFYVNHPDLGDDHKVNSDPVVFATITDPSGINISQSGIGHSLTLAIDGADFRNDLNSYFEQNPADPDTGYLTYPLSGLTPGRHTLTLTAWDNKNNMTAAVLEINVAIVADPVIMDLAAYHNPTSGMANLRVTLDTPNTPVNCEFSIHDLNGRTVRTISKNSSTDMTNTLSAQWDYCDSSGHRVPRGIYICRVRVENKGGYYASKSKKIAVEAE